MKMSVNTLIKTVFLLSEFEMFLETVMLARQCQFTNSSLQNVMKVELPYEYKTNKNSEFIQSCIE